MNHIKDDGEDWVKDFEENPENWESDIHAYNKKKDARVNIRVPIDLLSRLKEKAKKKGLPYQTFIYSELFQLAFSEHDVEEKLDELMKRIELLEQEKKNKAG